MIPRGCKRFSAACKTLHGGPAITIEKKKAITIEKKKGPPPEEALSAWKTDSQPFWVRG
jgi:hypothetical protein